MTQAERDRLHWLKQARDNKIKQVTAARNMGVSERWVRTLLKRLKQEGERTVVHHLRGRPSNHKTPDRQRRRIMAIVEREYADFGPTLASEYLAERHGLAINKETLRQWMIAAGLRKAKQAKVEKVHVWRARRACCGELVQWDTSEHDWLEGRGPKLYLIAMIDDATSRVHARFAGHDSTQENMRTLWSYLEQYGRPLDFYTDKASLFVTSPRSHDPEDGKQREPTEIGRALQQLQIGWIAAHSPQAKGRIERFFGTAQNRLVRGLRKAQAKTLEQANQYLERIYLPMWNQRFVQASLNPADAHRPLSEDHDLAAILCRMRYRQVANDYTFPVQGQRYQIQLPSVPTGLRHARVQVQFRLDGSIKVAFQDRLLDAQLCQPEDPTIPEPSPVRSGQPKRRAHNRKSVWMRGFDLQDAPSLGRILTVEKKAGRL